MIRLAAVLVLLAPYPSHAASDPNWPCQQIKVPELSVASVWSGAAVNINDDSWKDDSLVTRIAQTATRRTQPIDQAELAIHEFAQRSGDNKLQSLLRLLAGIFSILTSERDSVIAGLDRFGVRQKQLAAEIRSDNNKLQALRANPVADPAEEKAIVQRITWEVQIFQDRRQSQNYVCDIPVKIEQRFFALTRQIQRELD